MRYEINIAASLDHTWSDWFGVHAEAASDNRTRLVGYVEDQAALHGLLAKVRDLGLEIISITRVDDSDIDSNKHRDKDTETP